MNKKYIKYIAIGVVIILASVITISLVTRSAAEKTIVRNGYLDFILLGLDSVDNVSRADTIIAARIFSDGSLKMISIPRDTKVDYLGKKNRINSIYARGTAAKNLKSGARLLGKVLEENFSFTPMRFVLLDYSIFENIIDMIGGVDVYVSRDMYYLDKNGQLLIDIKRGVNHFDGKRGLEFVRFRNDGLGDIGRIERQKDFINSLLAKNSLKEYIKNPKVVRLILSKLKTDFSIKEALFLKDLIGNAPSLELQIKTLPGHPDKKRGGSYWIPSGEFNYTELFIPQDKKEDKRLMVELLNGNGMPGFGESFANKLRRYNYDVVSIRNADRMDYDKSVIFYFTGKKKDILPIKDNFGIDLIYPKETKGVYDVQIILGKDLIDGN